MDTKQPITLFVAAILVASAFSVVGLTSLPLQNASAQDVTIETSADEHGGTFFGEGAVQVIIEDDTTDDDSGTATTTIDVTIVADGAVEDSDTFTIPDTSDGSQRFEFFLIHEDSTIDVDLDGIADTPTIITFGDLGDLDTDGPLFDDVSIEVQYGDDEITIDYEEVAGVLSLDRDEFGSTSLVYIFIEDQDGNINPTERDEFDVTAAQLDDDLFELIGGSFPNATTFAETGDNTAIFEGIFQLTDAAAVGDPQLEFDSETLTLQLNDRAEYTNVTSGNNTSLDTSEVSFQVIDSDGEIDQIGELTFGTELTVIVRDNDQNIDSDSDDTIEEALRVVVDGGAGADTEFIDLVETEDNSGVFEIDLANSELRITFLEDGAAPLANNTILELRPADISEDLVVSYVDPLDDDSTEATTSEFTVALDIVPGQLSAPEEVGITDEFTVTLTEPDLNDNPRTRDAYTFTLEDEGLDDLGIYNLTRGGDEFGETYRFEFLLDGDVMDFTAPVTVTVTETGINTGIFEFEIDVQDITDVAEIDGELIIISDGDELEITIHDFMDDVDDAQEDSVSITLGRPSSELDFSRTTLPLPPEDDSATFDAMGGGTVITTIILVDPTLNTNPNIEETLAFVIGEDATEFVLEVDSDEFDPFTLDGSVGADSLDDADIDGEALDTILTIDALEETGPNTGVFEAEIEFSLDGVDLSSGDFQDAEFTFTYATDDDDTESAGFSFRGNDGIVTVDQPSAKPGTLITIMVEDQDLNLDDNEVDEFEAGALDGGLLIVETEDEEIPGIDEQTFEETGEDTGVFMAEYLVGDDIPVSTLVDDTVEQATNILVTFDDEIDSTGGGGDELEVNIPVVSSTGSIQVTPELVGPATTLTILIIDADLDEDAQTTDDYAPDAADEDTDNFFVSFSSSRNEVGEGSPEIEETGPNTGVFMFELELLTDEDDCADDDMDAFPAEGGSDSEIGACPGDLIAIRYEDELTGSGSSSTVSEVIEVMSWDPEFVADQDSYGVGDRVTVTISDPDANTDPDIANTLTDLRVTSDSDRVGEEFSAIETGRDTGVFRLTFGTSSGTAGGSISVNQGDDITIEYTDAFPADFAEEEEDKDFLFTINVGGGGDIDSTTVTPPEPQDVTGQVLDEVSAGQQVVLTTSVRNNNAGEQPFLALIEVRDSSGITVYLAWQTGTLPANGQTQVGLSWTPDFSGDYTVRTFVISDLTNPRVLSPVSESEITVS